MASPRTLQRRQKPLPKFDSRPVGEVSLPAEQTRNIQHVHNAPVNLFTEARSIPSPRLRQRQRKKFPAAFGERPQTAPSKDSITSAKTLAATERERATRNKSDKLDQAKKFKNMVKARVAKHVQQERLRVVNRRRAWQELEEDAQKTANVWGQGQLQIQPVGQPTIVDSDKPKSRARKISLHQHLLNMTAQREAARVALFAHSAQGSQIISDVADAKYSAPSTEEKHSHSDAASGPAASTTSRAPDSREEPVDFSAEFRKSSEGLPVDMHMHAGTFDYDEIERQSAARLLAVTRAAESKAAREAARRYRRKKELQEKRKQRHEQMQAHAAAQEARVAAAREENGKTMEEFQASQPNSPVSITEEEKEVREKNAAARYVNALRVRLLDRLKTNNMQVPDLCSCPPPEEDVTVASSSALWNHCANNCEFYNNPRDVKRIVSDLVGNMKYSLI